jgi:hypothetical protein
MATDQERARSAGKISALTEAVIRRLMSERGFDKDDYVLSEQRVREIGVLAGLDLERLSRNQDDDTSITKIAGYWAFWIRKLAPIIFARDVYRNRGTAGPLDTLDDINERVALSFAVSLIKGPAAAQGFGGLDPYRVHCLHTSCDRSACIEGFMTYVFAEHERHFEKYVIHCMRHKTFGPHNFVLLLEQLILGSCFANRQETRPAASVG